MQLKNIIDKYNMRQVIIDSASQLKIGLDLAKNIKIDGDFKNVIICGIGGSALPANVLNSVIRLKIPIYVHRDYGLPLIATENSLIICVSYSGNTEETISALQEAVAKKLKIIALATGGKIESICQKNNILLVKIPGGIQPRCATGYIFSSLARIMSNCGIAEDMSDEILKTSKKLEEINLSLEKEGKKLSEKLFKKIPVIYASNNLKSLARIWKIKFNENSKSIAFYNYFPELNHNEMVGYTKNKKTASNVKNLFVLILQDPADHPRILKRMKLTYDLIKKAGSKAEFVFTKEGSLLFKIFSTLLLGDWASYYLAIKYKIDPSPVKLVEEFKKKLEN